MASADLGLAARRDWILVNPWPWAIPGVILTSFAWLCALSGLAEGVRWVFILLGLSLIICALTLRFSSRNPAHLNTMGPQTRGMILMALGGLFGAASVGMTACLFTGLFLTEVPWRPGHLIILWAIVAPLTAAAALMCFRRAQPGVAFTDQEEGGALFLLAALGLFFSSRSLYDPADPLAWDTIRLFLAVFAGVCFVAAPLMLTSQTVRRATISLLIVLHFGGIATAALSVAPFPWIVGQVWQRIYRPYLEFMYLNNAYHFYSPEPGPASYLWFRIYYDDNRGNSQAEWYKIPKVDENGSHDHATALVYQRFLAVTENTVPSDQAPPLFIEEQGMPKRAPFYAARVDNSELAAKVPIQIGVERPKQEMRIPFYPWLAHALQYQRPNGNSILLLQSYARFVCRLPHTEHPDWKVKKVRIYRVQHTILPVPVFTNGLDPRDPEYYRPFYLGEYDSDGVLQDPNSPFLYWLLPIFREEPTTKPNEITNYAAKHAGDPAWRTILVPGGSEVRPHDPLKKFP